MSDLSKRDFSTNVPTDVLQSTRDGLKVIYLEQFPRLTERENIRFTMVAGYLEFMLSTKSVEVAHG